MPRKKHKQLDKLSFPCDISIGGSFLWWVFFFQKKSIANHLDHHFFNSHICSISNSTIKIT